jgi:hypothetical protein
MMVAATERDGRKLLVLGLEAENIKRLLNDQPIYKRLDGQGTDETSGLLVPVPGLEEWDVTILGPEDTVRFVAHVQR